MKRFGFGTVRLAALAAAATLILASCAGVPAVKRETGKSYYLTVLHTNDHHGTVLPNGGAAGVAERATFVKQVRAGTPNVLLIDAGDINTGSALSNMFKAEIDIKAYNMMGYDAVALGNHEFDNALSVLESQMAMAEFPWLSANVKKADGSYLAKPYVVKEYEGFRVGIFGITTLRTLEIASPDKGLTFVNEIEAGNEMVATLKTKEKCDVIIALTHLGFVREAEGQVTSKEFAEKVTGVNLIVDGHSHTMLKAPEYVNGTPIVSANEWGKYVGDGTFEIVDGVVKSFAWIPVQINAKDNVAFKADADVAAMIAPYKEKADATLKQVVANTAEKFEFGDRLSRKKEIALGNMVNDAAMWYVTAVMGKKADFAFTNGGNIRTELPKGDITREQITTVLPFDNWVYLTTMKGSDVIRLFEFIASIPQGAGAWAQVSAEARYTIDYSGADGKGVLKGLTIGGKAVDPAGTYTFVTNDYLMGGGDGYKVLADNVSAYNTSTTLRDIVIAYAAEKKTLVPATDGRITVIGGMQF